MNERNKNNEAYELAVFMHDFYEEASKKAGWRTQKKCRVPFSKLPEENQYVMIRMAHAVIDKLTSSL